MLGEYEYASVGVSPENWSDSPYSFALSLWMLLLDSLLYTALALSTVSSPLQFIMKHEASIN